MSKYTIFQEDCEEFLNSVNATEEFKNQLRQSAHAADEWLDEDYRNEIRLRALRSLLKEAKLRWNKDE